MDIPKEAAKIYETRDYEMFTFYAGNRNINEAKVKDLIRSFNERYYPVPIIVDAHNQVLDGQHRLEAARSSGFPVFFLTLPDDIVPTQVIRQLNADQKSYSLPDYMKLYVDERRGDYTQFQNLFEHYDKMLNEVGLTRKCGPYRILFNSMLGLLCGRDSVEGRAFLGHSPRPWDRGTPKLTELFAHGAMQLNASKGISTLDYLIKLFSVLPRQRAKGRMHRNAYMHLRTRNYLCAIHYLLHYRNEHVESDNEIFDSQVFLTQTETYPKLLSRPERSPNKWTDALIQIDKLYNHERGNRKRTYLVSL